LPVEKTLLALMPEIHTIMAMGEFTPGFRSPFLTPIAETLRSAIRATREIAIVVEKLEGDISCRSSEEHQGEIVKHGRDLSNRDVERLADFTIEMQCETLGFDHGEGDCGRIDDLDH